MKYRIIQTGEGYIIQHKLLGLFWRNHKIESFYRFYTDDTCKYERKSLIVYNSLNEAMEALKNIKISPIKHMGHKIYYATQVLENGKGLFVDSNSYVGIDGLDRATFSLCDENLANLKMKIMEHENKKCKEEEDKKEAKLKEKKDKEIINVWYED